jgi:hypothetical protein
MQIGVEIYKALKECRDSGFKDQITLARYPYPAILPKAMNEVRTRMQLNFPLR